MNAVAESEVLTLSLLGIVSGAFLAFALVALFRALGDRRAGALAPSSRDPERVGLQPWTAVAAAALALTAPLMWLTAARPLSDVPGLAAALFVQWLLVRARIDPRAIAFAALAAGLAAGIRSQVVWLTVPLLLLVVARNRGAWRLDAALSIAGAYVAGVLIVGRAAADAVGWAGRLLECRRLPGRSRPVGRHDALDESDAASGAGHRRVPLPAPMGMVAARGSRARLRRVAARSGCS